MIKYVMDLRILVIVNKQQLYWIRSNKRNNPGILSSLLIKAIDEKLAESSSILSRKTEKIQLKMQADIFAARYFFKIQKGDENRPKIRFIDPEFIKNFNDKIEFVEATNWLYSKRLMKPANDADIIKEIGKNFCKSKLAQLYNLLCLQGQGQKGKLKNDGSVNLLFSEDVKGQIQTVRVLWSNGWIIDSLPVDDPSPWLKDVKIFYNH
jgi:hypothetical protein